MGVSQGHSLIWPRQVCATENEQISITTLEETILCFEKKNMQKMGAALVVQCQLPPSI